MRLSEEVRELLRQGRETELAERAAGDARVVRPLLARLYDPDDTIRGGAARVLGHAAAAHPDLGREVTRRLVWGLNDESATNGVYGVPALGQIGRSRDIGLGWRFRRGVVARCRQRGGVPPGRGAGGRWR